MEPSRAPGPVAPLVGALALASALLIAPSGCGQDGHGEFVQATEEHALEEPPQPDGRALYDEVQPEIYYDLTRYEWYRHGEPLMVDGQAYQLTGRPQATMARRFVPLGRFEGVTYYGTPGAEPPYGAVYVPVFRGYWQPFVPIEILPPQTGEPG